ncbi:MAG: hypothetical protein V5A23_06305 [Halobacteriales archaeon]
MPDTNRITRRTALGLIGAGAVSFGLDSGAFSNATANRGASVDVTEDPNALLGLEGYDDDSVTPTVTNNSGYAMSITLDSPDSVEFDVGTDGNYVAAPVTFTLAAGATEPVDIKYTGSCTDAGSATVNKSVDLTDGGATVGQITLSRTWQIPQSGQVDVTGYVKDVGNSGKYEFELENTGCFDVTIVGLGINETTNPDAAKVGGKNKDDVLTQGGTSIVSSPIPIDNATDDATIVAFDSQEGLDQNQSKTFSFDVFRDASDKKVGMKGEDVKVTLEFSDGSTGIVNLCVNGGCSF